MTHDRLHYHTVKPFLRATLEWLMDCPDFAPFRLVGGTALSIRYGHRMSDDIDMFTDAEYGTIDFHHLQEILRKKFPYCIGDCGDIVGFGTSYIIGNSTTDCVKLDLFYTDPYIRPLEQLGTIRMASVEDIIAMKIDVITQGGRKKDFWDLHMLCNNNYNIEQMLSLYEERYPYNATREECITGLTNFLNADTEPDPICLQNKIWQLIKLDLTELASEI